jgi:integrase
MGRKPAAVPSYLRHASGNARCIINGITHYLGEFDTPASRARYDQLIAEWLASGRSRLFGRTADTTMATLMVAYIRHCDNHYPKSRGSESELIRYALRPVAKLYADLPAAQFSPREFKTVRDALLQPDTPDDKPRSRGYINAHMKRIARMFRWGAEESLVPAEVYQTIRLVKSLQRGRTTATEAEPVKPVAQSVVDATLPHCPPIIADMIRIQLLTGCRPAEVCNLTPGMIDRSDSVWVATLREHKTSHHGRNRRVYFGPKAQSILAPYMINRPAETPLFSPIESVRRRIAQQHAFRRTPANSGNNIGTNVKTSPKRRPGDKYTSLSYAQSIRRAALKAKQPHWTPNQLRHTAATQLRAQFGIDVARTILGHSKLDVTQIYAEQDHNTASRVIGEIG